jgi:hypothetical protein
MAEKIEIIQHDTLAEALLHAQVEYPPLEKGNTVEVATKSGGKYCYQYADLAYTRKVTDPHLWKHGLVIHDKTEWRDGKEILISTLTHVPSKECETSELEVTDSTDMKGLGANITYGRRYNYWNLSGRIGEDDSENIPTQRRRQPAKSGARQDNGGGLGELKVAIYDKEKQVMDIHGGTRVDIRKKVLESANLPDDKKRLSEYEIVLDRMMQEAR